MLWVKALHLIFMVTWFSGIFYLPRLFVYHAQSTDEVSNARFKIMERKLYYGISTPSAILTLFFGGWLLSFNFSIYMQMGWMHTKLTLILLLIIYHLYCAKLLNNFKHDRNKYSHVFYRWFNEFPVLILVAVILLATVKPF